MHVASVVPMDGLKHGTCISQLYKNEVGPRGVRLDYDRLMFRENNSYWVLQLKLKLVALIFSQKEQLWLNISLILMGNLALTRFPVGPVIPITLTRIGGPHFSDESLNLVHTSQLECFE